MKTPTRFTFAVVPLLTAFCSLHAADYTWTGATDAAWNTTSANWSGAGSTWVNSSANTATFGSLTTTTISFGENITVGTLSTTGGNTISFTGGAGTTLDVGNISTAGTGNGSIDLSKVLTGNHDLNYSSTATSSGGRLNLKTAADYTGDTFLSGSAYLNLDGVANNLLPTGTTVNLDTGSTLRLGRAGASQQIAGLVSTNASAGTVSGLAVGYTLTINTKTNTTTTFSGSLSANSSNILNLVISGSGTQALNGTNSYFGTTTISGGTLSLGSNIANSTSVTVNGGVLTNTANVTLGAGAVSMSSGEINIRGSATTGTFTVAANQNFTTTGGKLTFNIGSARDQILGSGTGSFNIGNTTEIALILGSGFSYANTYTILSGFTTGTSVVGSGVSITGYDTTNYVASLSTAGVLSFSAAAVPEPSTYAALVGVTILGFAAVRRRRTLP